MILQSAADSEQDVILLAHARVKQTNKKKQSGESGANGCPVPCYHLSCIEKRKPLKISESEGLERLMYTHRLLLRLITRFSLLISLLQLFMILHSFTMSPLMGIVCFLKKSN